MAATVPSGAPSRRTRPRGGRGGDETGPAARGRGRRVRGARVRAACPVAARPRRRSVPVRPAGPSPVPGAPGSRTVTPPRPRPVGVARAEAESRARGRAPGTRAPAVTRGTPRRRPPPRALPWVAAAPRRVPRAPGGRAGGRRVRRPTGRGGSRRRGGCREAVGRARVRSAVGGDRRPRRARRRPSALSSHASPRRVRRARGGVPLRPPPPRRGPSPVPPARAPVRPPASLRPPARSPARPPSFGGRSWRGGRGGAEGRADVGRGLARPGSSSAALVSPSLPRLARGLPARGGGRRRRRRRALRDATSDQTWRPAEFKHISQRRKRN